MAERGGQPGNNNNKIGKEGRRALELALEHYVPGSGIDFESLEVIGRIRTLIMMWSPIIKKAVDEGDLQAMKEINDRLDGRAAQSLTISGDEDNPLVTKNTWHIHPVTVDKDGSS